MRLPAAAPAPVLEPVPGGRVARACRRCEVTWYGQPADACWCCDGPGGDAPLRLFVPKRAPALP